MAHLDEIDARYWLMCHPHDTVGNIGPSDISVCCPICNEGDSWKKKFRLHLYIKDTYDASSVACFNCDYKTNLWNYLKENHPKEFELYRNEKRGASFNELKLQVLGKQEEPQETKVDISSIKVGLDFNSFDDFEKVPKTIEETIEETSINNIGHEEKALSALEISSIGSGLDFGSSLSPIKEPKDPNEPIEDNGIFLVPKVQGFVSIPQDVIDYIKNRGIEPNENWLYSPKNNKIIFNKTQQILSEFIIIPLTKGDKWYGFQALAWKQKKFFVYLVNGNSSWKVENWFNIDKEKPVYIMESIYDRLSSGLENSIAQLGANLSEERLKELKEPIFCLDNFRVDKKAAEESLKYSMKGYKVFIWPKGSEKFKDTNDLRKVGVSYDKIANMIKNNIYTGLPAQMRLKLL